VSDLRGAFKRAVALVGSAGSAADRAAGVFLAAEMAGPRLRRWLLRHVHLIARGGVATLLREALAAEDLRPLARAALAGPGAPWLRAEPIWTTRQADLDARLWTHETGLRVVHAAFDATGERVHVFGGGTVTGASESTWGHAAWFVILSGDGERRHAHPVGQLREDEGTFAVSPGQTRLAVRHYRDTRVYALPGHRHLQTLENPPMEGPTALHFLDERRLLVLDSNSLQLWDTQAGTVLAETFPPGWNDLAVSSDARYAMATGAGATSANWYGAHTLYELPTLRLIRRFAATAVPRDEGQCATVVDFAPSGRFVVTGDARHEVWLWNLSALLGASPGPAIMPPSPDDVDAELVPAVRLGQHAGPVSAVRFIDEHTVASGGRDGAVQIWDTRRPGAARRLGTHADAVTAIGVAPDHRTLLTAAFDGVVCRWDLTAPGDEPPSWTAGYRSWHPILTCPFDDGFPLGALAVSGSFEPGDPASRRLDVYHADQIVDTIHLDDDPPYVRHLDATTLATLGHDGHLTLWRLA
jgi:WD40 repeat protein